MKTLISLNHLTHFLVCCLFWVACQSDSTCTLSEEDKNYFKNEIANSQNMWNAGDREGYGNRYADAAIFMVPNGEALSGKDAIQGWLNTFPEIKVQFEITEIMGSCQLAAVRGTYHLTGSDGAMADKGKWLEIWQKADGSQWQLTRDIFNSDIPLPSTGTEEEPSPQG